MIDKDAHIVVPVSYKDRFKKLMKENGRNYREFLKFLMDEYEENLKKK